MSSTAELPGDVQASGIRELHVVLDVVNAEKFVHIQVEYLHDRNEVVESVDDYCRWLCAHY